jgi:antitoxin MazE
MDFGVERHGKAVQAIFNRKGQDVNCNLLTISAESRIFNVDTSEIEMLSKIQKWGNSLAVRIPKAFADEMNLAEGSSIQMMRKEGELIIVPYEERARTLEEMLSLVTDENLHNEWEAGPPVGKEAW